MAIERLKNGKRESNIRTRVTSYKRPPTPTKRQLAKITTFGKGRPVKQLAPPTPGTYLRMESSKFKTMLQKTSSKKLTKDFLKLCLCVEEIYFKGGPRFPKKDKIGAFAEN